MLHYNKLKGLSIWVKKCPYCESNHTQKKGSQNNRKRYRCITCGRQFQNSSNKRRIEKTIWKEYVYQRQTIRQLASKYGKSRNWIRERILNVPVKEHRHDPEPIVAIADVTFFRRSFGILVVRAPHLKKNIYVQKVKNESIDAYWQAKKSLEDIGYAIEAIVLDGRPGVRQLFSDIPVQMCHFHQKKIVTRYLTNNPKLEAGIELKKLTAILCDTNERDFAATLDATKRIRLFYFHTQDLIISRFQCI